MDWHQPTPTLILLDCQQGHFHTSGEQGNDITDTVRHIERSLTAARYCGWNVMHSQLRHAPSNRVRVHAPEDAPIEGLRPRACEAVSTRCELSAFSDPMFEQMLARSSDGPVFLVGFSLAFSILATTYDASARGCHLTLVEEAVGSAPLGQQSTASVRNFLFDLINQLCGTMRWCEVQDTWMKPGLSQSTPNWGIHDEHFRQQGL